MSYRKAKWGKIFRTIREELDVSQGFASTVSGLSQGYLSQLENNDVANPGIDTIARLAFAYGLPLHYILRRAGIDCGCGQYVGYLEPLKEEQDVVPPGK